MAEERIVIEIDDSKAVAAAKRANKALDDMEAGLQSVAKKLQNNTNEQESFSKKAASSVDRVVSAFDRMAKAGKSSTEEMAKKRSELVGTLDREIDRLNKLKSTYDDVGKTGSQAFDSVSLSVNRMVSNITRAYLSYSTLKQAVKDIGVETALYAARTQSMAVALEASAKTNRVSMPMLQKQETELLKSGIGKQEARTALLRMVSARMDTSQAGTLSRLGQNVGVIGGINSSEAFLRILNGIQVGDAGSLRELGINVNFDSAMRRAAAKNPLLGINDFSELEKMDIRMKELIRVAPQFAGIYEAAMTDVGKRITSLTRHFDDLKNAVGNEFRDELIASVNALEWFAKAGQEHPGIAKAGVTAMFGGAAALGIRSFANVAGLGAAGATLGTVTLYATAVTVLGMSATSFAKGLVADKVPEMSEDDLRKALNGDGSKLPWYLRSFYDGRPSAVTQSVLQDRLDKIVKTRVGDYSVLSSEERIKEEDKDKKIREGLFTSLETLDPIFSIQKKISNAQDARQAYLVNPKVVPDEFNGDAAKALRANINEIRSLEIELAGAQAAKKYREDRQNRDFFFDTSGGMHATSAVAKEQATTRVNLLKEEARVQEQAMKSATVGFSQRARIEESYNRSVNLAVQERKIMKDHEDGLKVSLTFQKEINEAVNTRATALLAHEKELWDQITGIQAKGIDLAEKLREAAFNTRSGPRSVFDEARELTSIRLQAAKEEFELMSRRGDKEKASLDYATKYAEIMNNSAILTLQAKEKIRKLDEDMMYAALSRSNKEAEAGITNRLGSRNELSEIYERSGNREKQELNKLYLDRLTGRISKEEFDRLSQSQYADRQSDLGNAVGAYNKKMYDLETGRRVTALKQEYDLREKMMRMDAGPNGEGVAIERAYQMRLELAQQEYQIQVERGDAVKAQLDYEQAARQAMIDKASQQLELYKQHFAEMKQSMGGLIDATFRGGGDFGTMAKGMATSMFLTPVKEGITSMIARPMTDMMWGRDGKSGLLGSVMSIFGSKEGGLQDVKSDNGAMHVKIVAVDSSLKPSGVFGGSGGGFSLPRLPGLGTLMGGGGVFSVPGFAGGTYNIPMGGSSGVGGGGFSLPAMLGIGGDMSGISANRGALMNDTYGSIIGGGGAERGGGVSGLLSNIMGMAGGGKSGGFNMGGLLGGLKGNLWNQTGWKNLYEHGFSKGMSNVGGVLSSALATGGLMMGGSMLMSSGLWGNNRGTGKGILQGTLGGAMTGAAIGTMIMPGLGTLIGAGVGAIAGLAAGVFSKLAGVESKRNQAKRLAREIYGLTINNNTADGIVNLAKQSFGGNVAVAMRSQEVRDMLQLWADSTGQKSMLYLGKPQSANLAQMNGSLGQAMNYRNGVSYSFESPLANFGGAGNVVPSGNPFYGGGNPTVVLNVNGGSAADMMEGRATQAVLGGSNRTSSANTFLDPATLPY